MEIQQIPLVEIISSLTWGCRPPHKAKRHRSRRRAVSQTSSSSSSSDDDDSVVVSPLPRVRSIEALEYLNKARQHHQQVRPL